MVLHRQIGGLNARLKKLPHPRTDKEVAARSRLLALINRKEWELRQMPLFT